MTQALFHLAFPIHDMAAAKQFYVDGLGCSLGRQTASAMVLGLYGHQIVAHVGELLPPQQGIYPRHFGLVFPNLADWDALCARAKEQGLTFYQQPRRRFEGTRLDHHTFFLIDPSNNLLEFKHYVHESAIFGDADQKMLGDAVAHR
ncbi:MAG: VOC family protein [Nitrospiraceae bacterium]